MKLALVCCIIISYFVYVLTASSPRNEDCVLNIVTTLEKNLPILLESDRLIIPESSKVSVTYDRNVTFLCPDKRNFLTNTQANLTEATCKGKESLSLGERVFNFKDFQCSKTVRGGVEKTDRKCGDNKGHLFQIGYRKSPKNFIPLIYICYDEDEGNALFSEHDLFGKQIKYASKSNYRPSFSPEGLPSDVSAAVAYKQVYQKSTFNKLLKSEKLAADYIKKNSYLARGHLSPDADFLYASWQYTSYYYLNTVPQWQRINAANWKKVEIMVRKFAEKQSHSYKVFTGTYQILELNDNQGKPAKLYLVSGSKLPVPKYIWKIVYSETSQKAVVLIVVNNPFEKVHDRDVFCADVCEKNGWGSNDWLDYTKGFVFCCEYKEFAKKVTTAPKLQVSSGVLEY